MKTFGKRLKALRFILVGIFVVLVFYFVFSVQTYGGRWFSNPYNPNLKEAKNTIIPGDIQDRNGVTLATSNSIGERSYNEDADLRKAVSHVVGDSNGQTVGGAENFQARYLLGFDSNVLERIVERFSGQERRGDDVMLTVDAQLSKQIASYMGDYRGSVVIMNYQTGEILAMVSKPGFDPANLDAYKNSDDGTDASSAFVNRATMGRYTPGSVFKIVTAASALRNMPDATTHTWNCDGPLVFDSTTEKYLPDIHFSQAQDQEWRETQKYQSSTTQSTTTDGDEEIASDSLDSGMAIGDYKLLRDYQSKYHGEIQLARAFAVSCNHTFAQIALSEGEDKLQKMATEFGFGTDFLFTDLPVYGSQFIVGETEYQDGWSAIGQYKDLVTPLHMTMISASIANEGKMMEPKLLRYVINNRGYRSHGVSPSVYKTPLRKSEADTLTEMMRYTITDGTGSAAAVSGYEVCGKTGTAEVSSDKDVGNHAWFTGFVHDDDHPLAISVVLEHAGSGGGAAAPVAGKALSAALNKGY